MYILLKMQQTLSISDLSEIRKPSRAHPYFALLYDMIYMLLLWNLVKLPIKYCYSKNVWLSIIDKLSCKLLSILYFQCFLCNDKKYWNFSVFSVFAQTPQNKYIINLYQKCCLGIFLKSSKFGHLIMCWIGKQVTGCYTTYM